MTEKSLREFDYNGKKVHFNSDVFKDLFALKAQKHNCKLGEYEEELGLKIGVSENAIHGWRNKKFGPADLDLIRNLAREMDVDFEMLIKETSDMTVVEKYDSAVRKCVIDMYRELSDYFEECFEEVLVRIIHTNDYIEEAIQSVKELFETATDTKDLENSEEYIEAVQNIIEANEELKKIRRQFYQRSRACKKLMLRNMLELPLDVYDEWDTYLTELEDLIDECFTEECPIHSGENVMSWEWPQEDRPVGSDEFFLVYRNRFYDYCKEHVIPYIQ